MKTRHFVLSLFCLFVLMAAPAMAADAASAPAPVAVLDMEAVVKNSVAGKGLQKELKARMDKIKAEAEAFKKDMADKEKALVAKYKESGDPKAVEAERKKFADELKASQKKLLMKMWLWRRASWPRLVQFNRTLPKWLLILRTNAKSRLWWIVNLL